MAGAKNLHSYVHVTDSDGVSHVFGPDDSLPAWARKAITNPKAYADDEPADNIGTGDAERAAED